MLNEEALVNSYGSKQTNYHSSEKAAEKWPTVDTQHTPNIITRIINEHHKSLTNKRP